MKLHVLKVGDAVFLNLPTNYFISGRRKKLSETFMIIDSLSNISGTAFANVTIYFEDLEPTAGRYFVSDLEKITLTEEQKKRVALHRL